MAGPQRVRLAGLNLFNGSTSAIHSNQSLLYVTLHFQINDGKQLALVANDPMGWVFKLVKHGSPVS